MCNYAKDILSDVQILLQKKKKIPCVYSGGHRNP